jgi:thiol-disulfide isomerase/thioredoxin
MNGCKHCEDMKPEWNKFKKSYKGSVELKEIEQSDMTPEQKEWVNGFPTLVLVENNAVVKTFDGATRTASEFQSFLDLNVKKV